MPDQLRFVVFTPEMLDDVKDFSYGDEVYQMELAHWIREDSLVSLKRGTKIWLYLNSAGDIVGYGSLGVTRWKYPETTSNKTALVVVPAVALRKEFWGKPDGPQEDRYSSQIMKHLLDEAAAWPGPLPAVGLFVHPENQAAIKLYMRFGFRAFSHTYTDLETQVTYRSFVRPLATGLKDSSVVS